VCCSGFSLFAKGWLSARWHGRCGGADSEELVPQLVCTRRSKAGERERMRDLSAA
jgi:hypothetical protein